MTVALHDTSAGVRPGRTPVLAVIAIGTIVTVSAALLAISGNPIAALAPVALVLAGFILWVVPLRYPLYLAVGLVILADVMPFSEAQAAALWRPPFFILFGIFIENLNKLTGIEALHFSGTVVVLGVLLVLAAVRGDGGTSAARVSRIPAPTPLTVALWIAAATIVTLEAVGVIRGGGDTRQSLWQFQELFGMSVFTLLVLQALHTNRHFIELGCVITAVACAKVATGLYYYLVIARPTGIRPTYVTSHFDTVLFVSIFAIWMGIAVFNPSKRRLMMAGFICVWMLIGIVINNRRTAFLGIEAVIVLLFALLPWRTKLVIMRRLVYWLPAIGGYLVAGTYRTTGIFAPAAAVISVTNQTDGSSATRDVENYNLVVTLRQHMVLGSGWGHEYVEAVKAYDISRAFAQYRFIAHNSVLWLWSIGGLIGFTGLWLQISVGVFLTARGFRFARTPMERAIAYGALAVYPVFLTQAWGDLGTQAWTSVFMLASALGVGGKLAVSTGGWPRGLRVFGRSRPPARHYG